MPAQKWRRARHPPSKPDATPAAPGNRRYDPGGGPPRLRGRSLGHALLVELGPSGRWPALGGGKGAVASGCGPGAPDHRRTKERQYRRRRYAANASIAAELADPVDRAFIAD